MEISSIIFILLILIGGISVFIFISNFKYKIIIIFILIFLVFFYFNLGSIVKKSSDIEVEERGFFNSAKIYLSWLTQISDNVKTITGNVLKMNWSVNETEINNTYSLNFSNITKNYLDEKIKPDLKERT